MVEEGSEGIHKVFYIRENHGEVVIYYFMYDPVEIIEGQDIFTSDLDPKTGMDEDNMERKQSLDEEDMEAFDKDDDQDANL